MKITEKVDNIIDQMIQEQILEEGSDTFVNILTKFGFKKGARDWGGHQFFAHKSKDLYATYHPKGRSLVIEPKRGGKPVFDSARSNFSIKALLSYLQSPSNKFISTEGGPGSGRPRAATPATGKDNKRPTKNPFPKESPAHKTWKKKKNEGKLSEWKPTKIKSFTDTHKDLMKLGFGNLIVSYDGIKKKVKDLKPRDIKGEDDLMIMKTLNTLHKKNLIRFDGKNFDITVNGQKNMRGTLKLEGKLNETWDSPQPFSSKEAKKVLDDSVRQYASLLRKAEAKIIKDWMTKAKAGVIDYFDIVRGLTTGDISRAYQFEMEFLKGILNRDKIMNRFKSYFGGKKSMNQRLVKKHKRK